MRYSTVLIAALLPVLALADINVISPNDDAYWVQNTSNIITWDYGSGDPNPISVIVANVNDAQLNGNFSIAEFVDLSVKSFTVTNVTLKVADGYNLLFVNPKNPSDVYAVSGGFSVKAPGTPPAPQPSGLNSTSSKTSSSASSTKTSTTAPKPTSGTKSNGALPSFGSSAGVFGLIAAAGITTFSAFLL